MTTPEQIDQLQKVALKARMLCAYATHPKNRGRGGRHPYAACTWHALTELRDALTDCGVDLDEDRTIIEANRWPAGAPAGMKVSP